MSNPHLAVCRSVFRPLFDSHLSKWHKLPTVRALHCWSDWDSNGPTKLVVCVEAIPLFVVIL